MAAGKFWINDVKRHEKQEAIGCLPNSLSLGFLESLYADYARDPSSVSADWRRYFSELSNGSRNIAVPRLGPSFQPASVFNPAHQSGQQRPRVGAGPADGGPARPRRPVGAGLSRARSHGRPDRSAWACHGRTSRSSIRTSTALPTRISIDRSHRYDSRAGRVTLRRILERLRNTYCRSIGVQFMHIDDLGAPLAAGSHGGTGEPPDAHREEQLRILTRLTDAVIFEEFIQKQFVGAKSFSLEGAESLIPLLGSGDREGRRAGHRRDRAGHGASRPAERAREHHGQEPAARSSASSRIVDPEAAPRPRRREVSPGLQQRLDDRRRRRRCTCRCASTRATWSSSTRWPSAGCGPSRTAPAIAKREHGHRRC